MFICPRESRRLKNDRNIFILKQLWGGKSLSVKFKLINGSGKRGDFSQLPILRGNTSKGVVLRRYVSPSATRARRLCILLSLPSTVALVPSSTPSVLLRLSRCTRGEKSGVTIYNMECTCMWKDTENLWRRERRRREQIERERVSANSRKKGPSRTLIYTRLLTPRYIPRQ